MALSHSTINSSPGENVFDVKLKISPSGSHNLQQNDLLLLESRPNFLSTFNSLDLQPGSIDRTGLHSTNQTNVNSADRGISISRTFVPAIND